MDATQCEITQVTLVLECYFQGLYQGDSALLAEICDKELVLFAPRQRRTLQQWLNDVNTRPVPRALGEDYRFKILSIELVGSQAMAKLDCPLLGHNYTDFIGLLKENNQWKIVTKIYSE